MTLRPEDVTISNVPEARMQLVADMKAVATGYRRIEEVLEATLRLTGELSPPVLVQLNKLRSRLADLDGEISELLESPSEGDR